MERSSGSKEEENGRVWGNRKGVEWEKEWEEALLRVFSLCGSSNLELLKPPGGLLATDHSKVVLLV